jgi:DNA-binding MarR family transcriptional regulator
MAESRQEGGVRQAAIDGIEVELNLLARNLELVARRTDLYLGLERAGYLLLLSMEEDGPVTVNQLALKLGLDASTVTRQVSRLVRRGLVARTSHPGDRRATLLSATGEGRARMTQVRGRRLLRLTEVLSDRSPGELQDICRHLEVVNDLIRRSASGMTPGVGQPADRGAMR